jgi:hypothetical protein
LSDPDFEVRVARGLRAPVEGNLTARQRIMERVRQVPAAERPRSLALHGRLVRQSIASLAFAAGIGSITAVTALAPNAVSTARAAGMVTSVVIGDTVVNRLRDTLRLVRMIREGDHRYAVVADQLHWAAPVLAVRSID